MQEPLLPGLGYSWIIVASPLQILMRRPVPGVRQLNPMAKTKTKPDNSIARNKKAWHDFFIEEEFEAGLALEGWEVKSLREGRAQLKESYVIIREGELFLFGAHFSPLAAASTHVTTDPTRMRKLLLHASEISKLIGAVERRGYTLVPLALYWKKSRAKLRIALAKGKKQHDKRATIRQREWDREQHRLLKSSR
jgi:SsrA-binding protein